MPRKKPIKNDANDEFDFNNLTLQQIKEKMLRGAIIRYHELASYLQKLPINQEVLKNVYYNLDSGMLWFKNFVNTLQENKANSSKDEKKVEEVKEVRKPKTENQKKEKKQAGLQVIDADNSPLTEEEVEEFGRILGVK